jgi:hypothetical protein
VRHQFGTQWHRFLHPAALGGDQILTFALTRERFPFYVGAKEIRVTSITVLADLNEAADHELQLSPLPAGTSLTLTRDPSPTAQFGKWHHVRHPAPQGTTYPLGDWSLKLRKAGAPDFRSVPADGIRALILILSFELGG